MIPWRSHGLHVHVVDVGEGEWQPVRLFVCPPRAASPDSGANGSHTLTQRHSLTFIAIATVQLTAVYIHHFHLMQLLYIHHFHLSR